MPWPILLTVLTLTLASAGLVFMMGWEPWQAFIMVGLTSAVVILVLMGAILILEDQEERAETRRIFSSTFRNDLEQVLKYFRIRKR